VTPPSVIRLHAPPPHLPCEHYQAWQAAREAADEALHSWFAAPYGEKRTCYAIYRALSDQENAAAESFLRAEITEDERT
jgi:hypothetical protein